MNGKWTYRFCEICLKNAHEEVGMNKRIIASTIDDSISEEMWCCPKCGSAKRL